MPFADAPQRPRNGLADTHLVQRPALVKRVGQVGGRLEGLGLRYERRDALVQQLQLHRPAVELWVPHLVDAHLDLHAYVRVGVCVSACVCLVVHACVLVCCVEVPQVRKRQGP